MNNTDSNIQYSNKSNENNPLVSIIVITYNSSKYVLETLESAKAQTYQNIELIVSDDSSTDNTIEICRNWIEKNKERFEHTQLITVPENTGIPANCNRGIEASKGEWIKLIAGDDLLLPNAIENNISFIKKYNEKIHFLFSNVKKMNENGVAIQNNPSTDENKKTNKFFLSKPQNQYKLLIKGEIFIPAATGFIKKQTILDIGGFDEEIRFCEDYPMWIKATKYSYKLHRMNEITVKYRIHSGSVMGNKSLNYHRSMKKVFFKYRLNPLVKINPFFAIESLVWNSARTNSTLNRLVPYILPGTYLNWLRNKLK